MSSQNNPQHHPILPQLPSEADQSCESEQMPSRDQSQVKTQGSVTDTNPDSPHAMHLPSPPEKPMKDLQPLRASLDNPKSPTEQNIQSVLPVERFDTFTCFPRLPPELRLRIFKFARPGPRVVEVNEGDRKYYMPSSDEYSLPAKLTKSPPALLHVNRESRYEALKHYELVPLKIKSDRDPRVESGRKIYFNFEEDTIYISAATPFRNREIRNPLTLSFNTANARRIKHLAIESGADYNWLELCEVHHFFTQLDTLVFVRDWSTWNLPLWTQWWGYHKRTDVHNGIWGLSLRERWAFESQTVDYPFLDAPYYKHGLMAYAGTGEFVPAYGDYLWSDREGPLQEPFLKGPEVQLLPQKILHALEILRVNEENGWSHAMETEDDEDEEEETEEETEEEAEEEAEEEDEVEQEHH